MTRNLFLAVMVLLAVAFSGCDQTPTTPTIPTPPPTPVVYAETSTLSAGVQAWAKANFAMARYNGRIARYDGTVKVYVYPAYTPGAAQMALDYWNAKIPADSETRFVLTSNLSDAMLRVVNEIPPASSPGSEMGCAAGAPIVGSDGRFTSGTAWLGIGLLPPPACSPTQVGWMLGLLIHEVGHTLGIELHTPPNVGIDIMCCIPSGTSLEGYDPRTSAGLEEFVAWIYRQKPNTIVR